MDQSSRPHRLRKPTLAAAAARVEALRRQRWTGKAIAAELGISPATVSRILKRRGLNRLRELEPAEPVRRYERERPGELIHIDIKKLGRFDAHRPPHHRRSTDKDAQRGAGWEFVHVCIDDASRIAFCPDPVRRERQARAFLKAAVAYYYGLGAKVARVMTDNGSCYRSEGLPRRLP